MFLLIFLQIAFSANPLITKSNECISIDSNLETCGGTDGCTFYQISDRATWDLDEVLQVYSDDYGWQSGTITKVNGDTIEVHISNVSTSSGTTACVGTNCDITDNRYSFVFRTVPPQEFIGMRVMIKHRTEPGRWFESRLTKLNSEDWVDPGMWAEGGIFGNMVQLQPNELRVSLYQDCQLAPEYIDPTAMGMIQNVTYQEDEALSCTRVYDKDRCRMDINRNCEWNNDFDMCVLNNKTNTFIRCTKITDSGVCSSDPGCKWLDGVGGNSYQDEICIDSASSLSVMLITLIVLLFC